MSDMTQVVEQDVPALPVAETEPEETLSIEDHAAKYSPESRQAEAEETEEAEKQRHHSEIQRRERDTGKFAEGKKRVRPSKDAAVRIAKAHEQVEAAQREAQTFRSELDQVKAELARLKASGASTQAIERAEAKVERAETREDADPEPDVDDPKYGGDFVAWTKDHNKWAVRQQFTERERQQAERQAQEQRRQESDKVLATWAERVKASQSKHPDFDTVAFAPTKIPSGSAIDVFIMEDDNGPEVLYHLQQHPEELESLLGDSVLRQMKRLSVLSDRLSLDATGTASDTRAVPRRPAPLPTPPTLVRTEAQPEASADPLDGSLSIAEHERRFGKKARR